jgi:hypothetical protein
MKNIFYRIIYYLVITPIGFVAKIFGVKFIHKGFEKTNETYWEESEKNKRSVKDFYHSEY